MRREKDDNECVKGCYYTKVKEYLASLELAEVLLVLDLAILAVVLGMLKMYNVF